MASIVNIGACALIDTQCIDWLQYSGNGRREMIMRLPAIFKFLVV